MIRVFLVDDHALVREGCIGVLTRPGDIEVVGQAGSAEEGLPLIRSLKPDVVLMDIHLPGISGLQATERLAVTLPDVRVIVLTMIGSLPMPQRLLEAGAWGYLTKDSPAEELLTAVRQVAKKQRYLSAEIASRLALSNVRSAGRASPVETLTPRELEVAMRLARGEGNKDIAQHLHVSEKTVSTHKAKVLEKLEVGSVIALANMLGHYGLLEPGTEIIP